jgi:DNA-binding LacI/PurR family transcriptional regulator
MSDAGLASISIPIETDSDPSNQARDAYNCMRKYLAKQEHPEAIFCYNDQTAIGAYRALQEVGLNIPDDVALVGCDGIDMSQYMNPALTTIVQPFEEMCLMAWHFLQNRMNNSDIPRQEAILKCRLEVRGSSRVSQHDTLIDTVQYSSASLK